MSWWTSDSQRFLWGPLKSHKLASFASPILVALLLTGCSDEPAPLSVAGTLLSPTPVFAPMATETPAPTAAKIHRLTCGEGIWGPCSPYSECDGRVKRVTSCGLSRRSRA